MPYVCIRLDVLTHSCVFTCAEAQNFMMSLSEVVAAFQERTVLG